MVARERGDRLAPVRRVFGVSPAGARHRRALGLAVGHPESAQATGGRPQRMGHPGRPRLRALSAIGMIDNAAVAVPDVPALPPDPGFAVAGWRSIALLSRAARWKRRGFLAERVGVIRPSFTEAVTAIGIVTVVAAPLGVALASCPCSGWP
jgi:hypothetical protein